jgi:hypothetical protein
VGLFLELLSPLDNSIVNTPEVTVAGVTSPDATLSVNGELVPPEPDGTFSTTLRLEEGPNLIEVIASDLAGNEVGTVLTVIYIP